MRSQTPKLLHQLCGRPMIAWSVAAAREAGAGRVVVVTGLSGAGKASVLRALEDIGYNAVDNPPLTLLETLIARADQLDYTGSKLVKVRGILF